MTLTQQSITWSEHTLLASEQDETLADDTSSHCVKLKAATGNRYTSCTTAHMYLAEAN